MTPLSLVLLMAGGPPYIRVCFLIGRAPTSSVFSVVYFTFHLHVLHIMLLIVGEDPFIK